MYKRYMSYGCRAHDVVILGPVPDNGVKPVRSNNEPTSTRTQSLGTAPAKKPDAGTTGGTL
ncbi:MAG: hypothetical protein JETCAE01_07780 [Anaerolineaceae bacterium]|nr:MAG: hypothetical protein JETCAE01_07780 [Anaerolineaceae bacterium]